MADPIKNKGTLNTATPKLRFTLRSCGMADPIKNKGTLNTATPKLRFTFCKTC